MGYTGGRIRDRFTIRESKSVTISYPKSESGGSITRSVDFSADVSIDVSAYVDSTPFDNSVNSCNHKVSKLTGAVVATQTAEVAAKEINARKVGQSLVDGFFGYIRSDISQQIAQLKVQVESILVHLLKLREQLVSKQEQMQRDYMRIRDRYEITFKDLDKEVKNRIMQLDRPAFVLNEKASAQMLRSHTDILLNTVTVSGGESSQIQSMIYGSGLKMRSLSVLRSANKFLQENQRLNTGIEKILTNSSENGTIYSPLLQVEVNDDNNGISSAIYHSPLTYINKEEVERINQTVENNEQPWINITPENKQMIGNYLQEKMLEKLSDSNPHDERVSRLIEKFWRNSSIKVYSN